MSLYDYKMSLKISSEDHPFYALIMAAMRQADDINIGSLRRAFPKVWEELFARYNTPGGELPEERSLRETYEEMKAKDEIEF
jgi:hypothetical protein